MPHTSHSPSTFNPVQPPMEQESFDSFLVDLQHRLDESLQRAQRIPNVTEIYLVKGTPKSKADLHRSRAEFAYSVILLGDDINQGMGACGLLQ